MDHNKIKPLIERWAATAQAADAAFLPLEKYLMAAPENPVRSAVYDLIASHTDTLANVIGGDVKTISGWLQWFAWECDFGAKPMEMIFANGEKLTVVGVDDLIAAIDTDESGNRK